MAEAADTCIRSMLKTCQASRAIPVLAHGTLKEKSARARSCCCSYLVLVLETWEAAVILKCAEDLEAAMKAAAQDASADTRSAARHMYIAYKAAAPEAAAGLLHKLEPSLASKLCKANEGAPAARAKPGVWQRCIGPLRM